MDARARADRRLLAADVEIALAFEHVDHLVVVVEVVGSPSGRDQADELGRRRARRAQHELAAGGGRSLLHLVAVDDRGPSDGSGSWTSTEIACASPLAVQDVPAGMNSEIPGRSGRSSPSIEALPCAREHEHELVGVVTTQLTRQDDEALGEHADLEAASVRLLLRAEARNPRRNLTPLIEI